MKITFDISPYVHHHAGLGRYAGELLAAMRNVAPHHEFTALYHAAREMEIEGELQNVKTARVPLGAKPWRMSVLLAYYMRMTMDRFLPTSDVFHGTDHLLPPLKNSQEIFTIHDLIFRFFPEYHLPLNRSFLDLMLPKFMRRADAIIAVSENTRRDVARLVDIPLTKIFVIYEGVSRAFHPINDSGALERVRAQYRLPPRFILFFSTIEPRKNLITLLDAYVELLRRHVEIPPLVVMGRKGWLYQETFQRIEDLNLKPRVILTDWVETSDVPAILSMAEIFVFPSLYEGFGLTPLEAMACGAPVISSNASSMPEVIGDAGILVEPRDVRGFADAIARVLGDDALRNELRAKGLMQASCFSWDRAARQTLALYEHVLTNGNVHL